MHVGAVVTRSSSSGNDRSVVDVEMGSMTRLTEATVVVTGNNTTNDIKGQANDSCEVPINEGVGQLFPFFYVFKIFRHTTNQSICSFFTFFPLFN